MKTPTIRYIRNTQALKHLRIKGQFNKHFCVYIGKKKLSTNDKRFIDLVTRDSDYSCILLHYDNDPYWSQILRDVGIAKSLSDAKGAGWHRKVDKGFQDMLLDNLKVVKGRRNEYNNPLGERLRRITVLNETSKERQTAKIKSNN